MISGFGLLTRAASGQTPATYVCFPTCSETDGHFLSVAGAGIFTLAGETVSISLTAPATASTLEIGVFDGETAGMWDQGANIPLEFSLYADPTADGSGTFQVGTWRGDSMVDNGWFGIIVNNVPQARGASGGYFYVMKVRSTNASVTSWSNFKIRASGTIALRAGQAFSVTAPLTNLASAQVIYPAWPALEPTTYDGSWTFYLNVPNATSQLVLWDGDMDFGSWDCSNKDVDDPDTPADLPPWAVGSSAVPEGIASSSNICATGDSASGNPTDDASYPGYRRSPSVVYEVIDPYGNFYANNNPSGNLEWEQFLISTAPFDRTKMDYHADSIPAGIYQVRMTGMDMQNLNAWRFGSQSLGVNAMIALGVDAAGSPVLPPSPLPPDTAGISGTIYYDGNSNGIQDATELGIPDVTVILTIDNNNDGTADQTYSTETDDNGQFLFGGLKLGRANVTVSSASIGNDQTTTADPDGVATPNAWAVTLDATHQHPSGKFGYHQNLTGSIAGPDTVTGSSDFNYTITTNQTDATILWTVTGAGVISGPANGSTVDIVTSNFGSFTVKATVTKNGSTRTFSKTILVAGIDFALFAYDNLYFKGRYTDATRGIIDGNVGVNNRARSTCSGSQPNLTLGGGCTTHNVYVNDEYRVIGDYVDLGGSKVSVYDLYSNRATGATSSAIKRHRNTSTCVTFPIISSCSLPVIPCFTYGCNNVTGSLNGTMTLAPGKYGTVTVRDGGTLNLAAGIYNIKSLIAGKHSHINTNVASKVRIASKLSIDDDSYVGPYDAALFLVRSDALCTNDASVAFNDRTEFHGQVFAPDGKIDLGKGTDLFGRFWGESITSDYDVNVTYFSPVNSLTHGNNDGFQKKHLNNGLNAITGEPSLSLMQNYPNPFKSTTTIGFNLAAGAPVTVKIIDASGREIRTLLDAAPMQQGANSVAWDGHGENGEILPGGTYFYRVESDGVIDTKPLVLVRD
ncbi:MAG: FlgD immunoglobulin-like domain containing protein [Candidatus Kapaibacterium sp.]